MKIFQGSNGWLEIDNELSGREGRTLVFDTPTSRIIVYQNANAERTSIILDTAAMTALRGALDVAIGGSTRTVAYSAPTPLEPIAMELEEPEDEL